MIVLCTFDEATRTINLTQPMPTQAWHDVTFTVFFVPDGVYAYAVRKANIGRWLAWHLPYRISRRWR